MSRQMRATGIPAAAVIRQSSNMPLREFTRNVWKTFDGGDIDENGRWYGAEMGCLECRSVAAMRIDITATYLLKQLVCGECHASFGEYWI